ncbi:MAG TPA: tetratricopeptide repeat protein [Ilumatobacteraceae bacterium]|nr:tetratricopeptide repeat protein [Ilumatobacteraceae bacterium]
MTGRYASRLAESWVLDGAAEPWRELGGSVVLADLSGFTRLTEILTSRGPEGVEVLHDVLTVTFDALLGASLALGGDVLGFAGDAALVWFDGDDHVARAVDASAAMAPGLAALPAARTGGARLQVSVGVHTGTFAAVLAGDARRGLFVCGPAMSAAAALQAEARPGQVRVSPGVAQLIAPSRRGAATPNGVVLRRVRRRVAAGAIPAHETTTPPAAGAVDVRRRLLSAAVCEVLDAPDASSDHRTASIGFVGVGGLDEVVARGGPREAYGVLQTVVETVVGVIDDLGVEWIDVDVGVDTVKMLLTAGAPRAGSHDEDRLLLALRGIVDRCPVPLRAGAQRGRVFAAPLGHAERRSYTVLGDPVNVAARALGLASDGDVVVGEGMGVAERSHVVAVPLGPIVLRNRAEPMPMWRVDGVDQHHLGSSARSPTSVGGVRADEWETLASAWKRTVDGRGCSVVIASDPGMGASQLIDELADLAGPTATVVVAHPFQRSAPYGAVADVAGHLARARGVEPTDPLDWLFTHADRLTPDLQQWAELVRADLAGDDLRPVNDPMTRAMQGRMVLASLLQLASPRPWLLAVDDFDRIDDVSRAVFTQLAEGATAGPVMFVGSVGADFPVSHLLRTATLLHLDPLDRDAAVAHLMRVEPGLRDDQIDRVVRAAAGNPFVLTELARSPGDAELPDSLQRLGAALVDRLPAAVRAVVREASAFGSTVRLDVFAQSLGRPELASVEWWSAAFPVMWSSAPGTVSFRHDALRQAAHDSLPFRRRRELHAAIAEHAVETGRVVAAELAFHYEQAGRPAEAYAVASVAGREAKESGAVAEAVALLEQAVRLGRDVERETVAELLIELGEARALLGDLDGADAAFVSAGRRGSDPRAKARACYGRSGVALSQSRFDQARRLCRRGLSLLEPYGDDVAELRGRLLLDRAAVLDLSGRHDASLVPAGEALALAVRTGNRTLEGMVDLHLGLAHLAHMRPEALDCTEAAVEIFEEIGHDRYLNGALNNSGLVAMYLGEWDRAIECYRRAAAHGDRCGNTVDRAIVEQNIGFLLYRQGHLDDAEDHARRSLRTADAVGIGHLLGMARYLLGEIAAADGRLDDARSEMATARAIFEELGNEAMVVDCDVTAMEQLVLAGRPDEARSLRATVETRLEAAEPPVVIAFERTVGRLDVLVGDVEAGRRHLERALDSAREHRLLYDECLCLRAIVAAAEGVAGWLPEETVERVRAEHEALVQRLGMVRR